MIIDRLKKVRDWSRDTWRRGFALHRQDGTRIGIPGTAPHVRNRGQKPNRRARKLLAKAERAARLVREGRHARPGAGAGSALARVAKRHRRNEQRAERRWRDRHAG